MVPIDSLGKMSVDGKEVRLGCEQLLIRVLFSYKLRSAIFSPKRNQWEILTEIKAGSRVSKATGGFQKLCIKSTPYF